MWGRGTSDHFCGYACMARRAISDTEVIEDHECDGHCLVRGKPLDPTAECKGGVAVAPAG